ncbi:MAG: hypothetical protein EXR65_04675 [Dehalococcoidia bacterium]|nr:hypothetical protein [Dehalococcoidia bacterium]
MAVVPRTVGRRGAVAFPQRVPLLAAAGLLLIAVAVTGLLQVLQSSRAATAGYEIRRLEREHAELGAEVRLLEADVARLTRVDAVRRDAIERLHMVPPQQALHISISTPAPARVALPSRYVPLPTTQPAPAGAWWERLLRRLPGLD